MRLNRLVLCLFAAASAQAQANNWDVQPSVSGSLTLSDNGRQSASSGSGTTALTVTPTVTVKSLGHGPVQGSASYRLESRTRFGGQAERSDLNQSLSARGKVDVVDNLFYVDGSLSHSQVLASLLDAQTDRNVNFGNRVNSTAYTLSPTLERRFGSAMKGTLRYTLANSTYGGANRNTSSSGTLYAGLNKSADSGRLGWGVDFQRREANNSRYADSVFERYGINLTYPASRTLRLLATGGNESNTFASTTKTGGRYVTAGFDWAPNQRTKVALQGGKRFFGNTYDLDVSYKLRSLTMQASYSEDLSDFSRQYLEFSNELYWLDPATGNVYPDQPTAPVQGAIRVDAQFIAALVPDIALLVANGIIDPTTAQREYVIKRFNSSVDWRHGKLGAGLALGEVRRIYLSLGGLEDRTSTLSARADYHLGAKTQLNGRVTLSKIVVPNGVSNFGSDRTDDGLSVEVGSTHRFSPALTGSLRLRHYTRNSNSATSDYSENTFTATFNYLF